MALCQLVQQHFTQLLNGGTDFCLWAMADSSYRGQREWMLQSYRLVLWDDLQECVEATEEIETILASSGGTPLTEEQDDSIREHSSRMSGTMWSHVMIPLSLGKKRMGLEYKLPLLY